MENRFPDIKLAFEYMELYYNKSANSWARMQDHELVKLNELTMKQRWHVHTYVPATEWHSSRILLERTELVSE